MKVLWLTNIVLPDVAISVGTNATVSGGWLDLLSQSLRRTDGVSLCVSFPFSSTDITYGSKINEVINYPFKINDANLEQFFEGILEECQPDVINIFGTERKHALCMINACKKKGMLSRTVVTIQGIISLCSKHYCAGLPLKVILSFSVRDLLKWDNILLQQKRFAALGKREYRVLREVNHIMGRTNYDKAFSTQINPGAYYYSCDEILRDSFYKNRWSFNQCEKHTIFVSASNYPLKGFHVAVEALRIIKKFYPDVKLYTTGISPVNNSLKERAIKPYYQTYIGKIIKEYGLADNIVFLGNLDEEKMCAAYLRCNVFASCSSVENSSNAICEAMLLGVPSVVSDVGGTVTLLKHESEGYIYQFGEEHMLAHYIMQLFEDESKCNRFSIAAREAALIRHDIQRNTDKLIQIYSTILYSSRGKNEFST